MSGGFGKKHFESGLKNALVTGKFVLNGHLPLNLLRTVPTLQAPDFFAFPVFERVRVVLIRRNANDASQQSYSTHAVDFRIIFPFHDPLQQTNEFPFRNPIRREQFSIPYSIFQSRNLSKAIPNPNPENEVDYQHWPLCLKNMFNA